ncbi:hypothetical protein GXB78_22710 [Pseudomonas moraviensis subsp. stanleyae]|uniref:hypothetical protein n=1 Tax=Pseudomonas moraviensis TaxID=321662 RepID=UPI002E381A70|nr:hypothetical protein [Pseudomonas moraviensis]MED7670024.1 hypothetical protein [Pseudomonas moraviensis subsp. stanleyae]
MADDALVPGGMAPTDQTRPVSGSDEPTLSDHDAPPGMHPGRDPLSDGDRPDDWEDPPDDEDVPPADEPTPLSDDMR